MMKKPVRIYFLCIQNRCRSQIAEAFAKHYGGEHVIVESAGLEPHDIHPLTLEVMKEVGIELSGNTSKKIDMKYFIASNVIVKLCQQVAERCPIVPFGITSVDWDIEDPLLSNDIQSVRQTRDTIEKKVIELLKGLNVPI
ncbi:arsenate reductase ArsC [Paenibacillus chondroitinus]|uniref:Arsenate reductase ArsC n=1 Tax=Paenibacillus chondroitinus TaxID=59842 RepID=A0ABU6DGX7_9BACL|nr:MULTISPECIES: arsenate reductase ArsC [Paenibacillus]MCY9659618.1 arsenate reductase ArsC [Paenibacillus anseongense]MEB4797014.1 arsenate reductase ArsC [Paenibacillus chondroitinus]